MISLSLLQEITLTMVEARRKHPQNPTRLGKYDSKGILQEKLRSYQLENDWCEERGKHSYEGIILEEVYEALTANTREQRHIEIVHAIGVLLRLDEDQEI